MLCPEHCNYTICYVNNTHNTVIIILLIKYNNKQHFYFLHLFNFIISVLCLKLRKKQKNNGYKYVVYNNIINHFII